MNRNKKPVFRTGLILLKAMAFGMIFNTSCIVTQPAYTPATAYNPPPPPPPAPVPAPAPAPEPVPVVTTYPDQNQAAQPETTYVAPPAEYSQPAPAPAPAPYNYQTFYDALAPYGTWVNVVNYGYVWMPTSAGYDFAPYATNGHWIMTN